VATKAIETIQASAEKLCGQVNDIKTDHEIRINANEKIAKIAIGTQDKVYEKDICIHCGHEVSMLTRQVNPTRRLDADL
jgi:RNA polymerase-binding transcription factor DksA